eukprot:TRINITY_DN38082_c0_g1_i1.p1 TRINITY_DN38082_c0_g1~~TRINITY_DN38082_c0_g1_i1.p1  ORF type:complete len:916 (+),score=93.93 TRINITY_DN38082_c0_g1_i1:55-2802(+)
MLHVPTQRLDPEVTATADEELWRALRFNDFKGAIAALDAGACPEHASLPLEIEFKNRSFRCQPLHVAVVGGIGNPHALGCPPASDVKAVVKKLLVQRGLIDTYACEPSRQLQAIHLVAGKGDVEVLTYLLESNADVGAQALLVEENGELIEYYRPIHEAVWFNRIDNVRTLLEYGAIADDLNSEGASVLHFCARLGHTKMIEFLTDQNKLLLPLFTVEDKIGTPLQSAAKSHNYPESHLHLLVSKSWCHREKLKAFMSVAQLCPTGAYSLLREAPRVGIASHGDENDGLEEEKERRGFSGAIDREWKKCIIKGADEGIININFLKELLMKSSEVASHFIDVLMEKPQVNDQRHPLPSRGTIPRKYSRLPISAAYQTDRDWESCGNNGRTTWHAGFIFPCIDVGKEYQIRVMRLRGLACFEFVSALAQTDDRSIFSKVVIAALLDFIWCQWRAMFVLDVLHEMAAIAVIAFWIVELHGGQQLEVPLTLRGLSWCLLTSQGLTQSSLLVISSVACMSKLGWCWFRQWGVWTLAEWLICACTLALAWGTSETLYPTNSNRTLLAAASSLQWINLLWDARAFACTGEKILPIIRLVGPIAGMAAVFGFLVSLFAAAFWALTPPDNPDGAIFDLVMFFFTGDAFMTSDGMLSSLILCVVSSFVVSVCGLNIFIAVLGDRYDNEQERLTSTFFRSRASICTDLFLRPSFPYCQSYLRSLLVALVFILASLLVLASTEHISFQWPAIGLCFLNLVAQTFVKGSAGHDWNERYLWIGCEEHLLERQHGSTGDESSTDGSGRTARLQRFINAKSSAMSKSTQRNVMKHTIGFVTSMLKVSNGKSSFDKGSHDESGSLAILHTMGELRSEIGQVKTDLDDMRTQLGEIKRELASIAVIRNCTSQHHRVPEAQIQHQHCSDLIVLS